MRLRVLAAATAVLAVVAIAGIVFAGRILVVRDPLPPHADAIVMLAGSMRDRVLEAADLWAAGLAPRIVVTRERAQPGAAALAARGVTIPESDTLVVRALGALGVPRSAIVVLHHRAVSTESEARTVARWACRTHARQLIIVTSPSHTRRARLIFRQALPDVALAMQPSRYTAFPAATWWRPRHHAKTVLSEWEKLVNYWLTERWTIVPCGGLRPRRRPA